MIAGLESILDGCDMGVPAERPLDELRVLRHELDAVELGLSYGRRMAQGRVDILLCELDRRNGDQTAELITLLPDVLSQHLRGAGQPRALRDVELPSFADHIVDELDVLLTPSELGVLSELSIERLHAAIDDLRNAEREIGQQRREAHRMIDELQEEIIGRYRSGAASVDDLLK